MHYEHTVGGYLHVVFPVLSIFLHSTIVQKCALFNASMEGELQSTTDVLAIEKTKPLISSFTLLFVVAVVAFSLPIPKYASF